MKVWHVALTDSVHTAGLQRIGWNEARSHASVECTYNLAHLRQILLHSYKNWRVLDLEKCDFASHLECQNVLMRLVWSLGYLLGRSLLGLLRRLLGTDTIPHRS